MSTFYEHPVFAITFTITFIMLVIFSWLFLM